MKQAKAKPQSRPQPAPQQPRRRRRGRRPSPPGASPDVEFAKMAVGRIQNEAEVERDILEYGATLVDPWNYNADVPDGYPLPTVPYRSRRVFYPTMSTQTGSEGRFAICLQPKLGDGTLSNSPVLCVGDIDYETADWTLDSNYEVMLDDVPLREDEENRYLAYGDHPDGLFNDKKINATYDPKLSVVMTPSTPTLDDLDIEVVSGTGFIFPQLDIPVDYYVTLACQTATTAGITALGTSASPVGSTSITLISNNSQVGSAPAVLKYNSYKMSVPAGAKGAGFEVTFTPTGGTPAQFAFVELDIGAHAVNTFGTGAAQQLRPVAYAFKITYEGEQLHDAGWLSLARGHAGAVQTNWLTNTPTGKFHPQFAERYARLTEPGTVVKVADRITNGGYGWLLPQRNADTYMYSLTESTNRDYPPLFIAGRYPYAGGAATEVPGNVLRIDFCVLFRYVTTSMLVTPLPAGHSLLAVERTQLLLRVHLGLPEVLDNPIHAILIAALAKLGTLLGIGLKAGAVAVGGAVASGALTASYNSGPLSIKLGPPTVAKSS